MLLSTPLSHRAFISDATVDGFSNHVERNQPDGPALVASQKRYYEFLLGELFDFTTLWNAWRAAGYFMEEHLARLYPKLVERWNVVGVSLRAEVSEVGARFRGQIARLMGEDYAVSPTLAERVCKGVEYFLEQCAPLSSLLAETAAVSIDNKETKKRFDSLRERIDKELRVKLSTLAAAREGFAVESYLEAKGTAIAVTESGTKAKTPKAERTSQNDDVGDDLLNPRLFELLREWRNGLAKEQSVPAYVVATQKALIGIANALPSTVAKLGAIKGIGRTFIEKYGAQTLKIVEDYRTGKIG